MSTPSEPVVKRAQAALQTLADDNLAVIRKWFAEGWVVLPPGWPDTAVSEFDALVEAEQKRRKSSK